MFPSPEHVHTISLKSELESLIKSPEFKIFVILNTGETITINTPLTSVISERFLGEFMVKNIEGDVIFRIPVEKITAKVISVE